MHTLKLICLTIIQLVKQARLLAQSAGIAIRQRRRLVVLNELEAERLDRIRNPSKYLGKSQACTARQQLKQPLLPKNNHEHKGLCR